MSGGVHIKKSVLFLLCILLLLSGCAAPKGDVAQAKVSIEQSDKFQKEEIEHAAEKAMEKFEDFSGCALLRLSYDEESSDKYIVGYMETGHGLTNPVESENIIVFLADFDTSDASAKTGFKPNSTYVGFHIILVRASPEDLWTAVDWGY